MGSGTKITESKPELKNLELGEDGKDDEKYDLEKIIRDLENLKKHIKYHEENHITIPSETTKITPSETTTKL